MQFLRSRSPATERKARTEKCPAHIAAELANPGKHAYYFELWLQCDRDWGKVVIFEKVTKPI